MSKISWQLAKQPNEYLEFTDDVQIKALLVEFAVESKFTRNPTGAKETAQAILFGEHPTHFILFVLYLGYDDPKQNVCILTVPP